MTKRNSAQSEVIEQPPLLKANGKKKSEEKIKVLAYRDKNRPRWKFVVNFHSRVNGERKRMRKFFETRTDANEFAKQKNTALKNTGIEGAEFSTELRVAAQKAIDKLKLFAGATIDAAVDHYVKYLEASAKSCTAQELVEKLIAAKTADGASKRYTEDLSSRLNRFAEKFDGQKVATITAAQINDWLRSLNVSPVSRNNYRRVLIVMFNYAVENGYATSNPAESTAKAKVVGEAPGILTVNETARLLEASSAEILPYLAIGAFAGLRRAELERLDWSDVQFDSDLIEVTAAKAKTARRRFVKMQPNLREWLLPLRKHRGKVAHAANFRNEFDAARDAAKITEWPDNALRHSFASYHLAHFKDAAALALEMGHTDSEMIFNHYRQLVRPNDAERYWAIAPAVDSKVMPLVAHV
jgi:integrase